MLYTSIAIYDLRIRNNPFGRVMGRKTVLVIRVLSSIGENFAEELQFQLTYPSWSATSDNRSDLGFNSL